TIEPQIYDEGDQIYDSVYLIPVFYHSLGPESKIYRTITRFLLKQLYIDLVHIRLFSELFRSSTIDGCRCGYACELRELPHPQDCYQLESDEKSFCLNFI
ncbi:unnamed protein product, partial [Rotaria magnacalcarata]